MVFIFYGGTYRLVWQKTGIPGKKRKKGRKDSMKGGREGRRKGKREGGIITTKKKNTS